MKVIRHKLNVGHKTIASVKIHPDPLPDDKILDWSKLKQIADDISKCIQNETEEP